jgi:tetratricopeptide (TPR) repeat protein
MADKPKNKATIVFVTFTVVMILILSISVTHIGMRLWFEQSSTSSAVKGQPTTQPVPFNAETREQVRDFVAEEIDRQTGRSLQHFNTIASALITVAATLIAVAMAIIGLGRWHQVEEHKEVMKKTTDTASKVEENSKRSEEYLEQIKEDCKQVKKELSEVKQEHQATKESAGRSEASARSSEASSHFTRAAIYYGKGEWDKTIEECNKAIERNPKKADYYFGRGAAWLKKGDFDNAIKDCEKAIERDPKNAAYYLTVAEARILIRDFQQAVERLKQGRSHNVFERNWRRLTVFCLEGIALALDGKDASEAEAEAERLLTAGTKASNWDCDQMENFLDSLKPKDFAKNTLETAKRIHNMLKSAC